MSTLETGRIVRPAVEVLSDEELVRRIRAGEAGLFELIMRRHNQRLYRAARAIVRDDDEAQDVMQQAYVSAYQHLHQFSGLSRFATWLTRIAVYEALARRRKRRRMVEMDALPEFRRETLRAWRTSLPRPDHVAEGAEIRRLLEAAIDALPVGYRAVLVLREVEGLSTAETAECLGLSEPNVKTRLHRAHALLRDGLYRRAGLTRISAFPFHLSRCDRVVAAVNRRLGLGLGPH
jgi:RNA polymerase sigma-70 factor (ECF subfamily)